MADCQRFLHADVYRFPYPRNLNGQNIYKISLVRLANYERLYPDRFTEVLALTRARLYERLGDYEQALHFYRVTLSIRGELAPVAQDRIPICENFHTVISFTIHPKTIEEYIQEYETRLEALDTLIDKCSGLDMEPLARLEKEKTQLDFAVFLQDNRQLLPEGTKLALELWTRILEENVESKNIQAHRIQLADFFFSLAKEYATWKPPERIGFEWDVFEDYAIGARNLYYRVSREDGYPEKREARGKLEAILSYIENIREKKQ